MPLSVRAKLAPQRSPMTLAACALFVVIACGKSAKSDSSSSDTGALVTVSGSLSDWPSSSGSFAGYSFALLNVDNGQVFRTPLGEAPGFSIAKVPPTARYNGVLLDSEYRFGWLLQITGTGSKGQVTESQAFQLGNAPALGSISMEGHLLRSSQQENLVPVDAITFLDSDSDGVPDGLQGLAIAYAKNTKKDLDGDKIPDSLDADLDNDGIPNIFDNDVDDDGVLNTFDTDNNQDEIADSSQPVTESPLIGISQFGFRNIFHQITIGSNGDRSISLWLLLGTPPGSTKGVTVASGSFLTGATYSSGEAFSGDLYDDGTHGDGIANDGVFSALVNLQAGKSPENDQLVAFTVTPRSGDRTEYLQSVGTILSGDLTLTSAKTDTSLVLSWVPAGVILAEASIEFQVLVFDANGRRVYTGDRLASTTTSLELPLELFTTGETYSCQVRALAPSPLTGFPGSAIHSERISVIP